MLSSAELGQLRFQLVADAGAAVTALLVATTVSGRQDAIAHHRDLFALTLGLCDPQLLLFGALDDSLGNRMLGIAFDRRWCAQR